MAGAESVHIAFEEGSNTRHDGRATLKHVCNCKVVSHPTNPSRCLDTVPCNTEENGHASLTVVFETTEVRTDMIPMELADVSHPPGLDVRVAKPCNM